jgi:hypothetical protein
VLCIQGTYCSSEEEDDQRKVMLVRVQSHQVRNEVKEGFLYLFSLSVPAI